MTGDNKRVRELESANAALKQKISDLEFSINELRKQNINLREKDSCEPITVKKKQSKNDLRLSEEKYHRLFDLMVESIGLFEVVYKNGFPVDYIVREVNSAFEKNTSVKRENVIGRRFRKVFKIVSNDWIPIFNKVVCNGNSDKYRYYNKTLDKHYEVIIYPVSVEYLAVLFVDTTEQRKNEEALRFNEERLKLAMEAANESLWEWNLKDNTRYLGPGFYKMLGYEPYEFAPGFLNWYDLLDPLQADEIVEKQNKFIAQRKGYELEYRAKSKTGDYKWILSKGKLFTDADGVPERMIGTHSEITARKKAEIALIESEKRINLILSAAPVIFVDLKSSDECLQVNWVSSNIEKVTGFPAAEFMEDPELVLRRINNNDIQKMILNRGKRGESFVVEFRFLGANNRYIWLEANVFVFEAGKNNRQVYAVCRDITETKISQEKLLKSHKQLRALASHLESIREDERRQISREIHDELGQSLTVLKLLTKNARINYLQQKGGVSEDMDEMASIISSTIKTVQKISSRLRPEVLDTAGLIPAIEWQAEFFQRHSGIRCSLMTNITNELVFDNKVSTVIFRVLQEALTNILRHSGATSVNISLTVEKGTAVLLVSDNGIGIPRIKKDDPESFGLTGMKERAILAGGKLVIKGAKNKGTSLVLKVPVLQSFN